jgi:putative DNA primase/helicase
MSPLACPFLLNGNIHLLSSINGHPTESAMLRGARFVTAQETEDGQRWPESKIKAMTDGDPISARFMRQDFFEFDPTFKLIVAENHKPSLRNMKRLDGDSA